MSAPDLDRRKLERFLAASGVEFDAAQIRPTLTCPLEACRGSAVLNRDLDNVTCTDCGCEFDVFDFARLLHGALDDAAERRIVNHVCDGGRNEYGKKGASFAVREGSRAEQPAKAVENLPTGVDPRTDMANAERFARAYGQIVRYCPERGGWIRWTGNRWETDPGGVFVRGLMRQCAAELATVARAEISRILDEMKDAENPAARAHLSVARSEASKLRTWARDSQQSGRVASSLKAVEELPAMMIAADALDADPWALNAPNGCVNLRTGEIVQASPEMLLTRQTGARWESGATAPGWGRFLEQILPDETVREWVQRWAGTCLTGVISDRIVVMFVGVGANGKSVFLNVLSDVLGDYAAATSPEFFASAKNQSSSREYQVAQIQGVRLLRAAETETGAVLNESLLKQITGGDPCIGRHPYGRPFSFHPICKPVLSTNNRPRLRDMSRAIYDRLAPIDFPVRFERSEQDIGLADRLVAEAPGVLQWAFEGLRKWIADGERLTDCAAIVDSVSDYRRDEDPLGDFLETKTVAGADYRVSISDMYDAYLSWANGEKIKEPLSKIRLGKMLKSRGLAQSAPVRGVRNWLALALADGSGSARRQDRVNQPEIDFDEAREARTSANRGVDHDW